MIINYYDILDVPNDATQNVIKKKYRQLTLQYHPDRNADFAAKDRFNKINEAYLILSDTERRTKYDSEFNDIRPTSTQHPSSESTDNIYDKFKTLIMNTQSVNNPCNMGAYFHIPTHTDTVYDNRTSDIQNGGIRTTLPRLIPSVKIEHFIEITLEEAYSGTTTAIEIDRWTVNGSYKQHEYHIINVNIFRGVHHNEVICFNNEGNSLDGGLTRGPVELIINIRPNTTFTRTDMNLSMNLSLSLQEAIPGTIHEFTHLNGKLIKLDIADYIILPNYTKEVPGLGMVRGDTTGSLFIRVQIDYPGSLSSAQQKMLIDALSTDISV